MSIDRIREIGLEIIEELNAPVRGRLRAIEGELEQLGEEISLADKSRDSALLDFAHGLVDSETIIHDRRRAQELQERLKLLHEAREILEARLVNQPPVLRIDMVATALRNAIAHAAQVRADGRPLRSEEKVTFNANLNKLKADLEQYTSELYALGASKKRSSQLATASEDLVRDILAHSDYDPSTDLLETAA